MPAQPDLITVRRQKGQIWSHIRKIWLFETHEETVRQEYVCRLVNDYGFSLEQMDEEVTLPGERGNKHAQADLIIWRTIQDRKDGKTAKVRNKAIQDSSTARQRRQLRWSGLCRELVGSGALESWQLPRGRMEVAARSDSPAFRRASSQVRAC